MEPTIDLVVPVSFSIKSTNVRYAVSALRAVAAISPAAAVALATRLFFVAPAAPRARPEEAAVMAKATRGSLIVDGERLITYRWGEGRPVLLMHGWGGRAAQMAGFVEPALAAGLSAMAVDAPAHGYSEGRIANIPSFAAALLALSRVGDRPAGLIAHSLGAAAGGVALARGLEVDRVVLISPSAWPGRYFDGFMGAIGFTGDRLARARADVERRLGISFDDLELPRLAPAQQRPALIIHDLGDREVSHAHGAAVAAAWASSELYSTQGLGHRRILGDTDVIGRSVRFVSKAITS